jgi:hypothetical protein
MPDAATCSFMNQPLQYSYDVPWRGVAIGTMFYAGLAILMARFARDLSGVLFGCGVALTAALAGLAVIMMTRRPIFPRVLELSEDAVLFPHGFPRLRVSRIAYTDIIRISEWVRTPNASLCVVTAKGRFEIGAVRFANLASYEAARDFICFKTSVVMTRPDRFDPRDWRIQGFPEPILRWVEPADWPRYRTHLVVSKPLLPRLAKALWFFVRCFGVFLFPWLLLHLLQLPTISIAGFLWLVIPVTMFFTSLHWLNATHPARATEISFRDHGITQLSGKQTRDVNYHDCSGWNVVERPFNERVLMILLLQWRGYVIEVTLPDTNTRDRLIQLVRDKHIPHAPVLKPSWESGA